MLSDVISGLIVCAFLLVGSLAFTAISALWVWRQTRSLHRSPLARDLLRGPGQFLRERLYELDLDLVAYSAFLVAVPVTGYAIHVSQSYFSNRPESWQRIATTTVIVTCSVALIGRRMHLILRQIRSTRQGLDGELATAEELNALLLEDCRVFHDVPTDYGNIDHVVIGPSGAYAVETKYVGKPVNGDGKAKALVDYHRNVVRLPDRTWPLPVDQAESGARWLSSQLEQTVGHRVRVEPMIALPGWFIERVGGRGICVFNPRNCRTILRG